MTDRDKRIEVPGRAVQPDVPAGIAALLAPLTHADAASLARAHASLEGAAAESGVLDIAFRVLDTPVGPLLLAATPRGLVRVAFACEDHEAVLATLAARLSPRVLRAPRRLDDAARQLDAYFGGARTSFDLPLDLALSRGFRRTVLEHLRHIDYGHTESYAAVARGVGNPRAVRAVGTACATNPLPVVIPCHRVLRSDGSLGGYAGGLATKEALLRLEHVA